jgi:hypothetical protein
MLGIDRLALNGNGDTSREFTTFPLSATPIAPELHLFELHNKEHDPNAFICTSRVGRA